MHPHYGMLGRDGLPPHKLPSPPRILRLWMSVVFRPKPFKKRLYGLGEARVCCGLRSPGCVATSWWRREKSEERDAGGLPLVGYVRVVTRWDEPVPQALHSVLTVRAEVDVMDLEAVLYVGTNGLYRVSLSRAS